MNLTVKSRRDRGHPGRHRHLQDPLVQLIPRLYDATEGRVLVGGVDVRDYDMDALRDQVAMVLQKNVLFSGTIKDNLRWGKKDATDEEMVRVCRLAQADPFIQEFPTSMTPISNRAAPTSPAARSSGCASPAPC